MKVRTKFTLWISLTALSTAAIFSLFVYRELLEEPYKLIDRELAEVAGTVFKNLDFSQPDRPRGHLLHDDQHIDRYWLKILDSTGKTVFASTLAREFALPLQKERESYFINQKIPLAALWIDPEDADELDEVTDEPIRFRVRLLTRIRAGQTFTLLIGKPLLFLDLELRELLTRLITGIVVTGSLICVISYFLAGRILQPLAIINQKIKEIRENSLNRRIPLGNSRDELYVLGDSLNTMFDHLQHSFARQKEFIGNAAHELKSPLTILMLGQEEMLADGPPELIRSELEKQLNTMRRLSKLVRNLLDISRLEQEETCIHQPARIDALIFQVLEEYKEVLQSRNITVETDIEECPLSCDAEMILRLLINLVDNAIKYNDTTAGRIKITARRTPAETRLTIANTSPEIPATDLPRLFDQFFRVEKSRSLSFGGSGLGLTIARRIVELHKGSIAVSNQNGWTTFTISLP